MKEERMETWKQGFRVEYNIMSEGLNEGSKK